MKNDVLEYIGLDLENVPQVLLNSSPIHFSDFSNSNEYRVYDYISVHDLEILVTPLDRTDELRERYKQAKPLSEYFQTDDLKMKHTLERSLDSASVDEIKKLEKLQEKLDDIPYLVKYDKNYLWQIYYSKTENKYFMLFPANEGESSVLFYIIKKKLEKEDTKIFVPVNKMDYSGFLLDSSKLNDLENYIWLFTNEWPNIYEVCNKYLYIIGKTKVDKIFGTYFRNVYTSKEDAENFYMTLKALFILTTETNYKYIFNPYVNEKGELELEFKNENSNSELITVQNLADFVDRQFEFQSLRKKDLEEEIVRNEEILKELKEYVKKQNDIYVMQEKQIVMFLDCKKSFFKKLTYFFKSKKFVMPKLDNKIDKKLKDELGANSLEDELSKKNEINLNGSYTIKDLVSAFNRANEEEIKARAVRGDIKALKLKKENYARKIENAKKYIDEIESHKKSIFEFWKFSNKDELPALSDGEGSNSNETKTSNNLDRDVLGTMADSLQRQKLSDEEINALYLFYVMPETFNRISKTYAKNEIEDTKKIENDILEGLKNKTSKRSLDNLINDYRIVKKINSKEHRENERNEIAILRINENTTVEEFKDRIVHFQNVLESAYNKIYSITNMPVYIKKSDAPNEFILGDINPENLIGENTEGQEIELVKIDLGKEAHVLYLSNIVFFDNQNKTLPIGMDLSSKVVIKLNETPKDYKYKKVIYIFNKENDFDVKQKKIVIY